MKLSYIKFRCSAEEKIAIQKRSQQARQTLSEYCRRQALTGEIKQAPRLTPEEENYFKHLHLTNANFARIANYMKYKDPRLSEEIREFLASFRRVTNKFFPKK